MSVTVPTGSFHQSGAWLTVQIVTLQSLLALVSIVLIMLAFSTFSPAASSTVLATLLTAMFVALQIINASVLTYIALHWSSTTFTISRDQIVISKGNLHSQQRAYAFSNVKDVEVHRSPLGGLLDYGTVSFADQGLGKRVRLPHVSNPTQYAELLQRGIQQFQDNSSISKPR